MTIPTNGNRSNGDASYAYRDVPLGTKRHIKIITIGGGASGINMAFQLKTHMSDYTHVAYERNTELGGTWLENRYPGCACDIPSHSYQYSWAPYSRWPSFYSKSEDIYDYMNWCVDQHDLRGDFKVGHEVVAARWDQDAAEWVVSVRGPDGVEFDDRADFLVNGNGVLNKWKWPSIDGLHDFKGHLVHSAKWDQTYDFKGKTIAVIGVGSTAVQIIPSLQPIVGQMKCFIRSPAWITPSYGAQFAGPNGSNFNYTDEQKAKFEEDPEEYLSYRKGIEDSLNSRFKIMQKGSAEQAAAREVCTAEMATKLASKPELRELLIPDFAVGCRRPTPGNGFLEALVSDNVDVVSTRIERVTANGIVTADGVEHAVDAIVCATGFDVSLKPRFPFVGRNGADLAERWSKGPAESYMSIMVDNHPNYFTYLGPSAPVAHGSVLPIIEVMSQYMLKVMNKMQVEPIRSIAPTVAAVKEFNIHRNEQLKTTVWSSKCSSWFKGGTIDGDLIALHPGSRIHFIQMVSEPRYEDMEIEYDGNRYSYLGNGVTMREVRGEDLSWYLNKPLDVTLPYPK
ncbi:hypothetical protein Q8F55_002919 [Vanrija albida]|uniref:Uncharacterized protein n=1 Tax=Vanrija albida TaxID=181172 RepID=A0ABR3QC42_9TREE